MEMSLATWKTEGKRYFTSIIRDITERKQLEEKLLRDKKNLLALTKDLEKTNEEPKCLFYGFSFYEDQAHCREGYEDAEGVLTHLDNVGTLLQEALEIADLTRLEIHGPEEELAKLREPLAELNPQFFTLEYGFRR